MKLFSGLTSGFRTSMLNTGRPTDIAVLDIGSSKLCCFVGRLTPRDEASVLTGRSQHVQVTGIGYQRSAGFKAGTVVDMDAAEQAVRRTVARAEDSAGVTIDSLIVTCSAGRLKSRLSEADCTIGGREVSRGDVEDIIAKACAEAFAEGRSVLHALPISYSLDGADGVTDPVGMVGQSLRVVVNTVDAETLALRNLETCLNRAHLSIDAIVATPYASGLASLLEDEIRLGAACVDMGAGTTTLSVFNEGAFFACDGLAIGGNHVTMDIARGLSIRVDDAERLKVLHGTALASGADEREVLSVPSLEEGAVQPLQVSVAQLSSIIRPRVEETFELLRDRINAAGLARSFGGRVILTGGASQLRHAGDVAAKVLGAQVRLGRPMGVAGLPQKAKGPAFSAASGLMIYPQLAHREFLASRARVRRATGTSNSAVARVGRWLRESF